MINKLKRLKIIVFFFRMISPGFGYCMKCKLPWNHCESKSIMYSHSSGTFATCQYCWDHSSLDELKSCYSMVYSEQYRQSGKLGMGHTRQHLLDCVERDYKKEDVVLRRKQKINSIKHRTKKNRHNNVTLLRQN